MRRMMAAVVSFVVLWCTPALTRVFAGDEHIIRIATLAPRGTPAFKTLDMWNASLQKKTQGRVKLTFLAGGVAGDERDVIRKMKIGQVDGSGLSSVGLGQIYRPILVLQMPGMFQNNDELHAVRRAMDASWQAEFAQRGFVMLGWFDVGFGRVFSRQPIERPTDYRKVRAWMWREDPMFPSFMEIVGATGVPLGLPEVFPALQTGMVDTLVASSVAAVGLQWFRYLTHMSAEASVAIVGASLITKAKFDSLPPDAREILLETSPLAHEKLNEDTRVAEQIAHQTLLSRGMKVFHAKKYEAEWIAAGLKLREKLIGRLFTREMLEHVEELVQEARAAQAAQH